MAFDEIVAGRIRTLLVDEPDITEMRMFGGLAFLARGNMAVAARSSLRAICRANPTTERSDWYWAKLCSSRVRARSRPTAPTRLTAML